MNHAELAAAVYEACHLVGSVRLRSGRTASEYFDKYRFEARPDLLAAIAEHLAALVPPGTEVLAGLELGGVPIATALALHTGMPAAFVRKQPKDYGTCRLAEGADIAGRQVLIVEDVVTSGGQVVSSAVNLRQRGAIVTDALCVIDRQEGGLTALASEGIGLRALFTAEQLITASSA